MDPTILSGLIDGRVELIIFITNSNVPPSLLARNYMGANFKNIEISYVFGRQLDNWLILHPEIYLEIFEKQIDFKLVQQDIIEFRDFSFSQMFSKAGQTFTEIDYFEVGKRYILDILVFSTQEVYGKLYFHATNYNFPFVFLSNESGYENCNKFKIKKGFFRYSFLIKANFPFKKRVSLCLQTEKEVLPPLEKKVFIEECNGVVLAYSQQLEYVQRINKLIKDSKSHVHISIYGTSGIGKTKLMEQIFEDNCMDYDIVLLNFDKYSSSIEHAPSNYRYLCKLALFISLGSITFQISSLKNSRVINELKTKLKEKKANNTFLDLIDGCFDSYIARNSISEFVKNIIDKSIQEKCFNKPIIFMLDNVQNLSIEEYSVLDKLISFDEKYHCNKFILSATKGGFPSVDTQNKYSQTPYFFELTGLSPLDVNQSLKNGIKEYCDLAKYIVIENFMQIPLFLNEYIFQINLCSDFDKTKKRLCSYNSLEASSFWTKYKDYYYLLDIIYQFEKGIYKKYITIFFRKYANFTTKKINNDILFLKESHLICIDNDILTPFHDYIKNTYLKTRKENCYNSSSANFYKFLYTNIKKSSVIDDYKVLQLLIFSDKRQYKFYKKELINKFLKYVDKTQYYAAYKLGNILYEKIILKKHKTEEECNVLYLYTDCINHISSSKEELLNTFDAIRKNSADNHLLKIEITASFLNEVFWQMQIGKDFFSEAKILVGDIDDYLCISRKSDIQKRLRRAKYTCYNRTMAAYLLIDDLYMAEHFFKEGIAEVKKNVCAEMLLSEKATYYMDYARGNAYHSPLISLQHMKEALKGYNTNKKEHFRRIILCKLDLEVLKGICNRKVNYELIISQLHCLYNEHFLSECYKGVLKYFACRLVLFSSSLEFFEEKLLQMRTLLEVSLAKIEYVPGKRDKFLLNQLLAYFYQQDYPEKSIEYLTENTQIISCLGDTYKLINAHNIENVGKMRHISWGHKVISFLDQTYYLDPRFW